MTRPLRERWLRTPRRTRWLLVAAGLALGGLLVRGLLPKENEQRKRPPVLVETTQARYGQLDVVFPLTGEVKAIAAAAIRPEVSGMLQQVHFREGQQVKAGQLLLSLDPDEFQAALNQARANSQKAEAGVLQARAEAKRTATQASTARVRAERYRNLGRQGAVSNDQQDQFISEADSAEATALSSSSGVSSALANLAAARAAEATARLQLQRTQIRSPIAGRAGQLQVTVGNYVRAQDNAPLLLVNSFSPIDVVFAVPQRLLGQLRPGLPVQLEASGPGAVPIRGRLASVDNAVDATTGTTRIKSRFANGDQSLVPGQFVKGRLQLQRLENVLLVPQTAVQIGQKGSYVYLASGKPKTGKAEVRPIRTGPAADGEVVVLGGLEPGDRVVTKGQFALSPGASLSERPGRPGGARQPSREGGTKP
ncbi:efflux RND transporter periplasmic adaptor subunit [Cyanobium sp. Morenito 9A2]|uniref:efflux RND transporter periplasmic adaptor subunit n=1 Tax=Cyanobium sp. Morenito 9A2 TaxID=2823718 RepID=UPI0020CF93FC|nr:efflux RND transporter periplasmic adaptor subunit [Cyanobium sp. Morenito 9A2]MCP9848609.1 efflux RND transporter periplasmic adaptor subunit [Cyanobium sp. Morenito 9A2]